MPQITAAAFQDLIDTRLPIGVHFGLTVDAIGRGTARLRMPFSDAVKRPVDVVSGPALMTLADVAMWGAVLSQVGLKELVVTGHLDINFLRAAIGVEMVAEASVMKVGRRLAVASVELKPAGGGGLTAHATASYAIPSGA